MFSPGSLSFLLAWPFEAAPILACTIVAGWCIPPFASGRPRLKLCTVVGWAVWRFGVFPVTPIPMITYDYPFGGVPYPGWDLSSLIFISIPAAAIALGLYSALQALNRRLRLS